MISFERNDLIKEHGLVHEKQMVDMDRNGRLPRLSYFCEYLLYA
jgi:hypothetical protein